MVPDKVDTEIKEASKKNENFYYTGVLRRFFLEKQSLNERGLGLHSFLYDFNHSAWFYNEKYLYYNIVHTIY